MAALCRYVILAWLFLNCALGIAGFPHVDAQIDPARSFWRDHVHYGYPHQMAEVEDRQGRLWNLAYLDLFRGEAKAQDKAHVLVLIHGRAMNSGYWGQLLEGALAGGFRVIAIDWSNSSKFLPANMGKPITRSLDDVRRMIFNLVVRRLGIHKASYLGHSLGGQVVAGYALQYPAHVDRLVLYAPGGLESFPGSTPRLIGWLADNDFGFNLLWRTGNLPDMGATPQQVENSFYINNRGSGRPYLQRGDKLGEFIVASRAKALIGNPYERERLLKGYAWDTLAGLMECQRSDPQALPNRIASLKVPTLLAIGLEDPVFPVPGTGNKQFVQDVIVPLQQRAKALNSPIHVKLYENAGHFIHIDKAELFSRDVSAFLQRGVLPETKAQRPE